MISSSVHFLDRAYAVLNYFIVTTHPHIKRVLKSADLTQALIRIFCSSLPFHVCILHHLLSQNYTGTA